MYYGQEAFLLQGDALRLKNTWATYQRLMNTISKDIMGKIVEVYIDNVVVKSKKHRNHLEHLQTIFNKLLQQNMDMNLLKCSFELTVNKFLGYLMTWHGIEANLG